MTRCHQCRAIIIADGERGGGNIYCSPTCYNAGYLAELAAQLPPDLIDQRTAAIHQGNCPLCSGSGPVDFHYADSVWSVLVVSVTKSEPQLSCRPCARQRQLDALRTSVLLGWWSLRGMFITPVFIVRNVLALRRPDRIGPSATLRRFVVHQLANEAQEERRAERRREREASEKRPWNHGA